MDNAATITFLGEDGNGAQNDTAWEFITKDKHGNEIDKFGCGRTNTGTRLTEAEAIADPVTYFRQEIPVIDFLGFSAVEKNTASSTIVKFRLTEYSAP